MYLVDSSVWVDFLRGDETPEVRALNHTLSGQDIVGIAPMILQEILQGADSAERFETWIKYFSDLFCYVPRDAVKSYIAAARLYQDCGSAGNTPRSGNDCLIAQIAIENGLTLLHNDRDFNAMASVVGELRLYPVSPQSSVRSFAVAKTLTMQETIPDMSSELRGEGIDFTASGIESGRMRLSCRNTVLIAGNGSGSKRPYAGPGIDANVLSIRAWRSCINAHALGSRL